MKHEKKETGRNRKKKTEEIRSKRERKGISQKTYSHKDAGTKAALPGKRRPKWYWRKKD